ncbi:replication initiation protein [Campylobacter sp. JMF_01 NE2]|uniref:replication initiation protein n=1 Tax=unclassified Campylobacter TaxID=2593542 RepID=UPI0022E9BB2E|nr:MULTISPECIES: replication initiation protein [unclassified Campylobacter]MDA3053695.1 replication initiation protein [Campylobacter sp. JMF_03 NE3]MDA3067886.1 replication initiation protein [Campylobacter sp. JMF_01 NE2]
MGVEIVKYSNKMNLLNFKDMSKIENNLFFAILHYLKEQDTREISVLMGDILKYTDKNLTMLEAIALTRSAVKKVVSSAIEWQIDDHQTMIFNLFERFIIDDSTLELRVKITETFKDILNNFGKGNTFTMFELAEFSELSSKYSQTIYRLCKQFRGTGEVKMRWADFLERLDIPKSYNSNNIDQRILNRVMIDFNEPTLFNPKKPIFKNFKIEKVRGKGKGRPITHIIFTFTPENTDNKKTKAENKAITDLNAENAERNFQLQFSGKIIENKDGEKWQIVEIKKAENGKIIATMFKISDYTIRKDFSFESIEILKNLVETYEAENQKKERKEIKGLF